MRKLTVSFQDAETLLGLAVEKSTLVLEKGPATLESQGLKFGFDGNVRPAVEALFKTIGLKPMASVHSERRGKKAGTPEDVLLGDLQSKAAVPAYDIGAKSSSFPLFNRAARVSEGGADSIKQIAEQFLARMNFIPDTKGGALVYRLPLPEQYNKELFHRVVNATKILGINYTIGTSGLEPGKVIKVDYADSVKKISQAIGQYVPDMPVPRAAPYILKQP